MDTFKSNASSEDKVSCSYCNVEITKHNIAKHKKTKKHIYAIQGIPIPYQPRNKKYES